MSGPLRIVQVNAAFDPTAPSSDALLERYRTLTAWSEALAAEGAEVEAVQRYTTSGGITRKGIPYHFVADGHGPLLPPRADAAALVRAVAARGPQVVHVNGLMFPRLVAALRRRLDDRVAIALQDHAGARPPVVLGRWFRRAWPSGFEYADAVSFTSAGQAVPWHEAGLFGQTRVLEIVEASTHLTPTARDDARRRTGLWGTPLLLWVGRLNANKDPLTVLEGLDRALGRLPEARVAMVWQGDAPLEAVVRQRVQTSPVLRARVTLVGAVPHEAMPHYYGAADAYLSGSRTEGSGYALIEALACGLLPIVTDIPPFRAIAGPCGVRWRAGDAEACAASITHACLAPDDTGRALAREYFRAHLSWPALARKTLTAYEALVHERQASHRSS